MQWGWTVASGVLGILIGGIALMMPLLTLAGIMGLIGGFAIVTGVALIAGASKVRSIVHPGA